MRPIPLIRAAGVRPFATSLSAMGAPVESLWARAGLPVCDLYEPDRPIPLFLAVRFAEEAARGEGVENLGLIAAQQAGVGSLGALGARLRGSLTLFDAIRTMWSSQSAWNSGARFWLFSQGEVVRVVQRSRWREIPCRQVDLATLALMLEIVRAAAGAAWRPAEVDLQSAGPCNFADFDLLAETKINTGRAGIAFSFPRSFLARRLCWSPISPTVQPASDGPTVRTSSPAGLASPLPADFVDSVRRLIGWLLSMGRPDVVAAADAAGMSVRSFQRRLAESGVSFSQLVDETRFALATSLLEDPTVKIIDVAFALAFSDAAHFTRAFRRWTSVSPLEHRRMSWLEREGRREFA